MIKTQSSQSINTERAALVVIGRNEGDRLKTALTAIKSSYPSSLLIYVDSGSSDDSVSFAHSIGAQVLELNESLPFTAARARNAGLDEVSRINPSIEFVQFVDGDCELSNDWLHTAVQFLDENLEVAIVSGRRAERFPEASIYNALMDIEWNTPVGETKAVLGDMCVRVSVFREVEGFSNDVIAAEDDDICIRIRALGHKILRLDAQMSTHDADIHSWSQWYRRQKRGGFAYAAIYDKHRKSGEGYFRRELINVLTWAVIIPIAIIVTAIIKPIFALILVAGVFGLFGRSIVRRLQKGDSIQTALAYTASIYSGKFCEFSGVLEYIKRKIESQPAKLIEYK